MMIGISCKKKFNTYLKGEKLEPISFEPFQSLRERNALSELIWICSAAGLKTIVLIRKVL